MSIDPRYAAGVPTVMMRGGTSKGLFFLTDDLPDDVTERDDLLLNLMGSPDARQIDGLGGAHPLTSKVAIVRAADADDDEADVAYLFLQVSVDQALVSDRQNCGNIVAGVGPFALEQGLVPIPTEDGYATVRIRLLNTGSRAIASVAVKDGSVIYAGNTEISGVPGSAAAIQLDFDDTMGSSCGSLLPTGNVLDQIDGLDVTMIDNGMPVVILRAEDVGIVGNESPADLNANDILRAKLESVRLQAGDLMNLGDVSDTTIPKMTMVSAPTQGGALNTRTFIPHKCHDAIGVLGAVSVATAIRIPGTVAAGVATNLSDPQVTTVEHPTGTFDAAVTVINKDTQGDTGTISVKRSGIVRTARKLMQGTAFPN